MASTKISFTNTNGDTLAARLDLPADQKPKAYALFAHCFTCNKNLTAVRNISRALNQNGVGVLRFDFAGLGESEGHFADTNFSSNIEDLISAASYMEQELEAPAILVGHSLGGAAVIFAGAQLSSVKAVATVGAPSSPDHVAHLLRSGINDIKETGIATINIGGRSFQVKEQFLMDIQEKNMQRVLRKLGKALLVMHSPQDRIVEVENAAEIYKAARHPKSFISLDGADHLLSNKNDSVYVGNIIANWAQRYLDPDEKEVLKTSKQVVVRIGTEKYTTEIKAGIHAIIADEPQSVGGNNYGPTPYDLLLASLGSCTAMTLRMYADRKKWDLQEVDVHLNHSKIHMEDCLECDTKTAKIDHIRKCIEFKGDLDDKQISRLLEIADRCPVHRTLHSEMVIETELL